MADYDNPRPSSQPIGSTDPAVVKDNLITLDYITESGLPTTTTRTGKIRRTLSGLYNAATGIPKGNYGTGVIFEQYNEYYTYDNGGTIQQWSVKDTIALPYTATFADPNSDGNLVLTGNASKEFVGSEIINAEGRSIGVGVKIYKGDNGISVDNGDIVPVDTPPYTHLRVPINGELENVAMSPIASGLVVGLTETGATIGGTTVKFSATTTLNTKNEAIAIDIAPLMIVKTRGYSSSGDGGHATYIVKTTTQATSDGDVVDEVLNFTMDNGNILVLLDRIGINLTLPIPSKYANTAAAMDTLRKYRIDNATVTIQVADGAYSWSDITNLNHPDGENIRILGNIAAPSNVTITFPNSWSNQDAFTVSNGHKTGLFDGFRIQKTTKADNTDLGTALLAVNGAVFVSGPNIEIDNFYYGAAARVGSTGVFDGISVNHAGDVGIWAFVGSTVSAVGATSNNVIDGSFLGFGLQAEYGSSMNCDGASASGCQIAGVASLSNSNVRAPNFTSDSNIGSGALARDGATIESHDAIYTNNGRYGVELINDGFVYANSLTMSGNTLGNTSNHARFDNGTGFGARIVSQGPLRIDNGGSDPTYFNTSGGVQFEIGHTASAVNRPKVRGGAIGEPARYEADGDDTNIDIHILPKGSGRVYAGSHNAGTATTNGYIELVDSDGAILRIPAQRL